MFGARLKILALVGLVASALPAYATPQFARTYGLNCTACHTVPPMLNARGQDFLQRGYRPSAESDLVRYETAPVALWMTGRQENQLDRRFGEMYLNRVELISAGPVPIPIIEDKVSYFLEWRAISLESRTNGTLRDRSGRFEDAFLMWQMTDRLQLTGGQFRALQQVDVSRRLSVSEPAVFSTSLAGDPGSSARVNSLRAFAPAGRSPGFMLQYQSIQGDSAANGLFHSMVIPFVGEWSFPITPEAHTEADFVSQGPPKGIFLETWYRYQLNTIGAHVFADNDRWLLNLVAQLNYTGSPWTKDFHLTGVVGWDDSDFTDRRNRWSVDLLYLPTFECDRFNLRPGFGFRAERVTGPGTFPAYIPYFVLAGPNTSYTGLLQIEYRHQENNRAFFLDLSLLF